jgi:RNase H-like domain found in reverse transcriptase/Reverse transcriptase (RNA-dependent DNA polymerase)/Integrase zinc binding domain
MDDFLDENLVKGCICPSKSPMALPFFFVAKKDSDVLRPSQDYHYLNDGTIKNAYPLPLVSDLLDKLKGAQWFTKLDIWWGYHNVRIKDGNQWKGVFKTNRGLFELTVMFFGLCNSPMTFQAMMNDIFWDMIEEAWIVIYMDDILIFSKDLREHQERTRWVLQHLQEHNLYLKAEKCCFEMQEVEFLGMIIRPNQLTMDPMKLAGIKDWLTPTNVKVVCSFLGFGNFYRRFIGHFADLACPLNDLTKKNKQFQWMNKCQTAFDALKKKFAESPILLMPDPEKPFIIESDASKFATGAVLRQKDTNGNWHLCGYISHSFDATQRNYEIYDQELLGMIRALKTWRHYLLGSPHPITILSDHKNLTYFWQAQKLNRWQACWSLFLSQFDLKLQHVPGSQMVQSDMLSRRANHVTEENTNNENMILLPDTVFVKVLDAELHDLQAEAIMKDDLVTDALWVLKNKGTPLIESALEDWKFDNSLLFFRDRCYIPQDVKLRRTIMQKYHDSITTGHPGQLQTLELIWRDYWWLGMMIFIKHFMEGCTKCQQMKVNTHPTTAPLSPIEMTASRPFELVTTDSITDLPENDSNDSIMVMVDHGLTKGVIFIPCNKTIDALGAANLYLQHVYTRFGLPEKIISNRDPRFASHLYQELGRLLGVKLAMSTTYHPQTDGKTELVNQELEVYLHMLCSNNPKTWKQFLHTAEFSHNQKTHFSMKNLPFYLMMGYHPWAIPIAYEKTNIPTAEQRIAQLLWAREEALAAHELARQLMASWINKKFKPFKAGDKVWLESKKELKDWLSHQEAVTKTRRPVHHTRSTLQTLLPTKAPTPMENPPSVPCSTSNPLQRKQDAWGELSNTSPWPDRRTGRIWGWNNHCT